MCCAIEFLDQMNLYGSTRLTMSAAILARARQEEGMAGEQEEARDAIEAKLPSQFHGYFLPQASGTSLYMQNGRASMTCIIVGALILNI